MEFLLIGATLMYLLLRGGGGPPTVPRSGSSGPSLYEDLKRQYAGLRQRVTAPPPDEPRDATLDAVGGTVDMDFGYDVPPGPPGEHED